MQTKLIKTDSVSNINAAVEQACGILAQGGLVAFPTETVYGLAVNAELPHALERLSRLKERPDNKPFTLHIGDKTSLNLYVPNLSPLDRQLIKKAWPGPLTVVFCLEPSQTAIVRKSFSDSTINALYYEDTIGIRLPDHPVAQQLLSSFNRPVVAPSANLAGAHAPTTAEEVIQQLDGKIELVIDTGPTRYGRSSTVVLLESKGMMILREGVFDTAALERMHCLNVLFVCTGNTCRSPMAAGLWRQQLAEKLSCSVDQLEEKGYKVYSAGVTAFEGARATAYAVEACRNAGVDISDHQARLLAVELVKQADYIFVMERSHYKAVTELVPQAAARTMLLASDGEIEDPIGMAMDEYGSCANRIARCVRQRLAEIFP